VAEPSASLRLQAGIALSAVPETRMGNSTPTEESKAAPKKRICGIIMPISGVGELGADHWREVLGILTDCAESEGFDTKLVSVDKEPGIIQKTIVENLYLNEIVICDVSAKNPNVMFELGMRLAFDKRTIVVKDDRTDYSFDTSPIEHVGYPRDLRFNKIVAFKLTLREKLRAAAAGKNTKSFLKSFGPMEAVTLEQGSITVQEHLLKMVNQLTAEVRGLASVVKNGAGKAIEHELARYIERPSALVDLYSSDLVRDPIAADIDLMLNKMHAEKAGQIAILDRQADRAP
jgi:hypothetical protein